MTGSQYANPAQQQRLNPSYGGSIEGQLGMDQGNLARAIHAVMKSVQYVEKRGHNAFHNYNYAMESDVVAAIRRGMIENDLVMMPRMHFAPTTGCVDEHGITHVIIEYTVVHTISGERGMVTGIGSGSDKNRNGVGDKGVYKAITGAHKYAMLKLFQIETGDDPERENEVYEEKKAAPRQPEPGRKPPLDDDIEVGDPRDDEPRDDPRDDEETEDDRERERERDGGESGNPLAALKFTRDELKEVIEDVKSDRKTVVLKVPEMGDEAGHKWELVEEVFRQFVTLHETPDSLVGFWKEPKNVRALSMMEREAPKRYARVKEFFSTQKKAIQYRNKDQMDMRKDAN